MIASAAVARRRGPLPRQDSAKLKARILDCAERLFAEHGYHGTSIRDIAAAAEAQLALVGYHFGSKEQLLDAVVARRAEVLRVERLSALTAARERSRGRPVPPEELIRGFVECFLARAARRDSGWRSYAKLVADLANSSAWGSLVSRHYDDVARDYLEELKRSYPSSDPEQVVRGFFYVIGVMVSVCSRTGRIERLSDARYKSADLNALLPSMIWFMTGGLDRLLRRTVPKTGPSDG